MKQPAKPPTTDELLKRLQNAKTVDALMLFAKETEAYDLQLSFAQYIEQLRKEADVSPASLIEAAQIQRNYGYQILNGTRRPGRDKVVALCLALRLSLDDTQRALTIAQEGILYPKNPRDSILIFCINKKMSVMECNALLDKRAEALLV